LIHSIFFRNARFLKSDRAYIETRLAEIEYQLQETERLFSTTWKQSSSMTRVQRSQKRDGHSDVEKEGEITMKQLQKQQRNLLKRYAIMKKHDKRTQNFFKSVAVVGYTNVGKSSLIKKIAKTYFESLNQSESNFEEHDIEADKYFATLDIQGYFTDDHKIPFTLFDTVGLISDVPLELFDAFRETFIAAKEADVVVHVIDASSPVWKYHAGICSLKRKS